MKHAAQIIGMDASPTGAAVSAAVMAELNALVGKHVATPDGQWPSTAETAAKNRLYIKVARTLLGEALNSEAMHVVDAVIACDAVEAGTVWGRDLDYDTPATDIVQSAENFADYTREACAAQIESAAQ